METKKTTDNLFDSVVLENADEEESQTVLVLHLVILVTPVTDDDVSGNGLNA